MKFINLLFFFSLILSINLFAQKPKVVATASMISDMTSHIAGDKIDLKTIVPIGSDPHLHEATPRDASIVSAADLILKNGLTFEGWLNELIENSGTKGKTVQVTEGIKVIQSAEYANSVDPHAWMDLSNGLIYIQKIKDALIDIDPANKDFYTANYEKYKGEIIAADKFVEAEVNKIPTEKRILITSHDAFQYYGKRYGIKLESVLGTSTDAEAQTSDIIRLNKVIRENKIPAVFIESTINPKLLKQLASDNDITVGGELYADSIGEPGSEGGSYIDMIKHNTKVIVAALTKNNSSSTEDTSTATAGTGNSFLLYGLLGVLLIGGLLMVMRKMSNN